MYLKKLELSGFKSFAKSTILEFPHKITSVVGPNGSGKSNIKEGIQWVLGEQSIKSLRGKKGEDLIWNGSPQVPRVGKGSVTLVFDNGDRKIPLDFEEVIISRRIFRDGANEYYINDSQVRLKDVIELMAKIGLGATKHNIISQGEVDRILLASPAEKREMLEEALGLRIFQLKKQETERKLEATKNNTQQVEALIREISPHLKFLRQQAERQKARGDLEIELKNFRKAYFSKEHAEIRKEKENLEIANAPLKEKLGQIRKEISQILQKIARAEKKLSEETKRESEEAKLNQLETKRRELTRELGRLEGRLEIEKEKNSHPKLRVVDTAYVQEEIMKFVTDIRAVLQEKNELEALRNHLSRLAGGLESLWQKIYKGKTEDAPVSEESELIKELQKKIKSFQEDLAAIAKEAEKFADIRREEQRDFLKTQTQIRELDSGLRRLRDEERNASIQLERSRFNEERLKQREIEFQQGLREANLNEAEISESKTEDPRLPTEELKKKIQKIHLRIEEIGGTDESVVKEFQELESRHAFLTKELEDLKQANNSLKELLKELEGHILQEFKNGFTKIKDEFNKLFRSIFGGGKATMILLKPIAKSGIGEEETETAELEGDAPPEEGVEISVDLPRKRIKGLAMLSGGERALTSIALLFAITSINPPPFLILDETDAALDEANSQRYASILKELAKKTQLIIVTHNRETMKSAGVLYGVTMGDDGVSRLLSIKLEEAEAYTNR